MGNFICGILLWMLWTFGTIISYTKCFIASLFPNNLNNESVHEFFRGPTKVKLDNGKEYYIHLLELEGDPWLCGQSMLCFQIALHEKPPEKPYDIPEDLSGEFERIYFYDPKDINWAKYYNETRGFFFESMMPFEDNYHYFMQFVNEQTPSPKAREYFS
ncbi:MAG: hypothetical protein ACW99G_00335 [Candidatus Thorarchaeota archaeon]|jgi:hypothetical protein